MRSRRVRVSDRLLTLIDRREVRGVASIPLGAVVRAAWAYRMSGVYLMAVATALLGLLLSALVASDPAMHSARWAILSGSLAALVFCGALLAGSFFQMRFALRRGLLGTAVVIGSRRSARFPMSPQSLGAVQTYVTASVSVIQREFTQTFALDESSDSPPAPGSRINVLVHPARDEVLLELGHVL